MIDFFNALAVDAIVLVGGTTATIRSVLRELAGRGLRGLRVAAVFWMPTVAWLVGPLAPLAPKAGSGKYQCAEIMLGWSFAGVAQAFCSCSRRLPAQPWPLPPRPPLLLPSPAGMLGVELGARWQSHSLRCSFCSGVAC